ncbi:ABC transporter substrate-binding protein, partial [Symbiobacterium thermophilum]
MKIGWIGPLSGANKTYGESAKRGVELALEEAGYKVGDLTVELIAGDDRSDSTEAVNLATKMMTQDRVAAIIGPVTSGSAIAVSAIAETYKVPMITATATA